MFCLIPNKQTHVYNVDVVTSLTMQVETLYKKIDRLSVTKQQAPVLQCDLCGGSHGTQECQALKGLVMANEQVEYMGNAPRAQNNLYSKAYNPGWSNSPKFFYGNQGQNRRNSPPRF